MTSIPMIPVRKLFELMERLEKLTRGAVSKRRLTLEAC
jgi:hypothetical protein